MFSHVLRNRASIWIMIAWEDQCFHNKSSPQLLSLPQLLLLHVTTFGLESPFGRFSSAVLVRFPPQLLPTTSLCAVGVWRAGLGALPALLSACQSTAGTAALLWLLVHSTALYGLLWGKSTPPQPDPAQQYRAYGDTLLSI